MAETYDAEGLVEGNFDQIRIYDAPVVAFSQILDGEASWRSFRDTFLDPGSLSAAERDSFTGKLKASLGNNPLGNALVDVATNPFVLLMFVTSPAGGAAVKGTGRVFTGLAKEVGGRGPEYLKYLVGNYSPLRMTHLLNAHQLGAGTPLTSVLHEVTTRLDDLTAKDTLNIRQPVVEALQKISAKFGTTIESLDPSKAPAVFANIDGEMVSAKEYLKRFNVYAYAHMAGMTKPVKRSYSRLAQTNLLEYKVGDKIKQMALEPKQATRVSDLLSERASAIAEGDAGQIEYATARIKDYLRRTGSQIPPDSELMGVRSTETSRGFINIGKGENALRVATDEMISSPLDPEGLTSKWLEKEGFMPILTRSRAMMKERYAEMFLKGGAAALARGRMVYDEKKLLRVFNSLADATKTNNYQASDFLIREVFGGVDDSLRNKLVKAFEDGSISFDNFKKMLVDIRSKDDIENFMSRNVWSFVYRDGKRMRVDASNLSRGERKAEISSRQMERQLRDPLMDIEDLERIQALYGDRKPAHLASVMEKTRKIERGRLDAGAANNRIQVMNLDYLSSFNKYLRSTRNDLALFVDPLGESSMQAIKDFAAGSGSPVGFSAQKMKALKYQESGSRFNAVDAIANMIRNSETSGGQHAHHYIMDTLMERIQGNVPMKDYLSEWSSAAAKRFAGWFSNSRFMKEVEKTSESAQRFVGGLRQFAEDPLTESSASRFGRNLTSLLYSSHLGFNLGSASLNLMQPLMFATSSMGAKSMIKGYSEGIKQYFEYIQKRLTLPGGLAADPLKVDELRKSVFRLSNIEMPDGSVADLLDIRKNAFELLDSEAFAGVAASTKPGLKFWATELPLKLFTNTEIFNRVVTGEAMLATSRSAGQISSVAKGKFGNILKGRTSADTLRAVDNVRQMVQNTQFGSDIVNSPALLQSSGFGLPWVRQFFSFPIRTLSAWTDTASMINQGRRTWGALGFTTQGRYTAMMHDLFRMMGASAIMYEAGKNALGVDLSRGLSGQTLYESTIVGPMLLEGKEKVAYHLPIPPAGDILMDAVNALTQDDVSLIGTMLPRFVPGGIGLSRILNAAPRFTPPTGWLGGLQQESADWTAMNQQGQIPIYRSDGSLLEYRSAPRTILGSLGFNSYMFKNDQALNQFLVKNRQAVVDERRKYLDAVLANDMGKASRIKAAFEKRFKFPLSVSKDQVDRAIQLREVPLKERMYQRMSPEMRPQVRPYLAERLESLKSRTPEELDLSTAEKARVLPSTFESYDPYQFVTE